MRRVDADCFVHEFEKGEQKGTKYCPGLYIYDYEWTVFQISLKGPLRGMDRYNNAFITLTHLNDQTKASMNYSAK